MMLRCDQESSSQSPRITVTLDEHADLGLEAHVKHAIGFIKNQVLHPAKINFASLDEIDEAARCSYQHVAPAFQFTRLTTDSGTAIDGAVNDRVSFDGASGIGWLTMGAAWCGK